MILKYGVDVPYWDEWDPGIAGLYIKAHQHRLTFSDLTAQHNEHRILVPKLAWLVLGLITKGDTIARMLLEWTIVCATSAGVLVLCLRTVAASCRQAPRSISCRVVLLWFICNLLIFSPAAWQNWLWGMGVANVMPMAWIISSLIVAGSPLRRSLKISLAILLSSAATFSSGNGALSWPLTGALLAWSSSWHELKRKKCILVVWVAAFIINVALFAFHFKEPAHPPGERAYFAGFVPILRYIIAFLGGPFALGSLTSSTIVGTVELALYLAAVTYFLCLWLRFGAYELCGRVLVWLLVATFAVFSGIIASLFRAGIGVEQALSSRYVTFAVYLPVGLVMLTSLICQDIGQRWPSQRLAPSRVWLRALLLCALMAMQVLNWPAAFNASEATWIWRREAKGALLLLNVLPENPQLRRLVYPEILPQLAEEANALNRLGLLRPHLIAASNAADLLDQGETEEGGVPAGRLERIGRDHIGQTVASGWAILPKKSRAADAVFLTFQRQDWPPTICSMAEIGYVREDVARDQGNPNYLRSGWVAAIPLGHMPDYMRLIRISAWALDTENGKAFKLKGEATLSH